jgi:acyl-CoA thioester hydrolase
LIESPIDEFVPPDGVPSEASNAAARSVFDWPIRVYYEDTDAGGIVYYANYLRFFERARTEWLRSLGGPSHSEIARARDEVFVVRGVRIEYLRPARLDDVLNLGLAVSGARRASATLRQWACRQGEDEVLAEAEVRIAMIRRSDGRPVGLPDWLTQSIQPGTAR